jgi:hypothetical protein
LLDEGREARVLKNLPGRCFVALVLGFLVSLGVGACGDDGEAPPAKKSGPPERLEPPSSKVTVDVVFPNEGARLVVGSLHLWVLSARPNISDAGEPLKFTCSSLVGGETDPYDVRVVRQADVVTSEVAQSIVSEKTLLGTGLAYVEGIDFAGNIELAGCAEITVTAPETTATVTLTKARVFDCTDSVTEEGAPCDDGKLCTVGETCKRGACQGGGPRNCTHVADPCNAEACDEQQGCIKAPLADRTPCDDRLRCTDGDVCLGGQCVGTPKDCTLEATSCREAIGCNEALGGCQFRSISTGSCDDGRWCTETDYCSGGTCIGATTRNCSSVVTNTQCQTAFCDETLDACVPQPRSSLTSCTHTNPCVLSARCDGAGSCASIVSYRSQGSSCSKQCWSGTTCDLSNTCSGGTAYPDGSFCNDGNPATLTDSCMSGVCVGR